MTDSVDILFSADLSDLQRGLREASSGIAEFTAACKASTAQVAISYADLTRAYAAGVAERIDLVKAGSTQELAIARAGDRAQTDILLDGLKVKESQVKEEAQLTLISHDEERASLLALEADRVAIEQRHLAFLQQTYQGNAVAFANVQRQIDELSAQSAVKRQQIEAAYARQVYNDYRTTFEQIGSSVSQQVTGLISGQTTFKQAVANVLLAIIQDFVAARLKIVADWAAGTLAQTAATQAGETAKTGAVVAGTAARTSAQEASTVASLASSIVAIGKSIIASAAVSQNEFDAMASLGFNIGAAGLKRSSVVKRLNLGDPKGAAAAFMAWSKPAVLAGRRRAEAAQFLLPGDPAEAADLPAARAKALRQTAATTRAKASRAQHSAAALVTAGAGTAALVHSSHPHVALTVAVLLGAAACAAVAIAFRAHVQASTLAANAARSPTH